MVARERMVIGWRMMVRGRMLIGRMLVVAEKFGGWFCYQVKEAKVGEF
jgi:hypothetical protein